MAPNKVIIEDCEGFSLVDCTSSYTKKDVILYAMGVGLSHDPLDDKDLQFTYENHENFSALPCMAVVLLPFDVLFEGLMKCPGMPSFNPMLLLHGEQKVVIHQPLETEAQLRHSATIKRIYDKQKAALVIIEMRSYDQLTSNLVCTNEVSLYIRGIGGFGGPPAVPSLLPKMSRERPPDYVYVHRTTANQALIYRLSGDYNPLHVDPNMAAAGGFDKPILHGLCSFGIATRAIIREICNNDPNKVYSVAGRFASPVIPGQTIRVEMWIEGSTVLFLLRVIETNAVCLTNGVALLKEMAKL